MSAREMAARADWTRANCPDLRPSPQGLYTRRVLVQEIPEGRPTFKAGDPVRTGSGARFTVDAAPYHSMEHGAWFVPVVSAGGHPYVYEACDIKPLPRETSRLVRVTGTNERAVEDYARPGEHATGIYGPEGRCTVRVEVVNDPEGGER